MKVVPLSEAKANLSRYGSLCQHEPVVVTVNGAPAFQLVPIQEDEDLIDALITNHPEFRRQIEKRLKEKPIPWEKAKKKLGLSS
jgi:antitoxin (DNA-binding transcriptional repressor) of toxin-antitoxin stability system